VNLKRLKWPTQNASIRFFYNQNSLNSSFSITVFYTYVKEKKMS